MQQLSDDDVWLRRKAPNTLVLHGRVGNCVGDMAAYDYFTLGGPYSVRGYSPGELGACRWVMTPPWVVVWPLGMV
jgi:outer membrane protein assembly factor BamA